MSAADTTLELDAPQPHPPHPPARQRVRDRIRDRFPWALPLAIGAWVLSFERLSASVTASGYVDDWWEAAIWAGIVDYAIWVGYVGLRRDPRSVRSWVLLCAGSAATIWFQADWSNSASWVPPVALLLALWVLERDRPHRTAPPAPAPTPNASAPTPTAPELQSPTSSQQEPPAAAEQLPEPTPEPSAASGEPASAPGEPEPAPTAPESEPGAPDGLRDLVERIYLDREVRDGQQLVAAELARELNRNEGSVRNALGKVRRAHRVASSAPHIPHLPHQGAPELNGTAPSAHAGRN